MDTSDSTDLSKKILARADLDGLPETHELRQLAKAFDVAAKGFYADQQIVSAKQFLGAWARVRTAWCNYSGESLI